MFPTPIITVDPQHPDALAIRKAADLLRAGKLVVFPTETVYGLGANACDFAAVARIFEAKGRPPNNPLIVHVTGAADCGRVVSEWPDRARLLAEKFWPGPLTLVLSRHPNLPANVTAGGPTVAVRAPAHPVAQKLLIAAAIPIAAPSANPSGELSPTAAEHLRSALAGHVDLILDAGATQVGIESTVVDLTSDPPQLLRPGYVGPAQIEAVIGPIVRRDIRAKVAAQALASPGLLSKHYSPRTALQVLEANVGGATLANELHQKGLRVGWVTFGRVVDPVPAGCVIRPLPNDPAAYAARLYATLHELDGLGLDRIIVDLPPPADEWLAVRDRMLRAAAQD